jgi:hypothetical protein
LYDKKSEPLEPFKKNLNSLVNFLCNRVCYPIAMGARVRQRARIDLLLFALYWHRCAQSATNVGLDGGVVNSDMPPSVQVPRVVHFLWFGFTTPLPDGEWGGSALSQTPPRHRTSQSTAPARSDILRG